MNKKEIQKAIEANDFDIKNQRMTYKNTYDETSRKEIFKLCKKIQRHLIPKSVDGEAPISFDSIRPFSISSLKVFENSALVDYFEDKSKHIKVVRKRRIDTGDAEMKFFKTIDGIMHYKMVLPKGKLCVSDQLSYSHELGHIPALDIVRESFLEYDEVFPIFMEFLSELKRHNDLEKANDYFSLERLPLEQSEASDLMKIYKKTNHHDFCVRVYNLQLFADNYKYLESLDFALQMIDRMKDDRRAIGDELENIIRGQSINETALKLDINTDGCERLLKEYRRLSR